MESSTHSKGISFIIQKYNNKYAYHNFQLSKFLRTATQVIEVALYVFAYTNTISCMTIRTRVIESVRNYEPLCLIIETSLLLLFLLLPS